MSVKIFLSTVSDEFRAYREQLRSDLTRHNVEVKVQEDFKDLGGDTLDKLDVYIADCDAVVHLAGDMTGAAPGEQALRALRSKFPDLADKLPPLGEALQSGAGVSYTQWEAWLALYHGKLLVIAKAADSAERGPQFKPTDGSRAAQAAHLQRLKGMGRYPGCIFTSPDNLAKSVLSSAILDLLVENIIIQRSGSGADADIQSGRPYLRLTQYVRRTKLAARDNSETALLSAYRADVVPLIGRDRDIGELRHWLDGPASMSIRVLIGAGGRGKTRLALELARDASKDGWLAGFASAEELDRFRSQGGVEQWRWDRPVLVIVDYAAGRAEQIRDWLSELVDASLEDRPKLRLLLLERQANRAIGWLSAIFGLGDNDASRAAIALLDPPEPVELPPLDELKFRREVFATLLKRANAALEAPALGADPEFDRLLADRKWAGDPLYLMMAGLAAATAGVRAALTLSRADLALSTARNELDRIGRIGAARGIDKQHAHPGAFVRHMAVMATLVQGLDLAEARTLATKEREALGSAASLDATIAALDRRAARGRRKRRRRAHSARHRRRGRNSGVVRPQGRLCGQRSRPAGEHRRRRARRPAEGQRHAGPDRPGFRRRRPRRTRQVARSSRRRSRDRPRRADGDRRRAARPDACSARAGGPSVRPNRGNPAKRRRRRGQDRVGLSAPVALRNFAQQSRQSLQRTRAARGRARGG